MELVAIVPAAGRSRRMGRPKQLLEVAGRPLLEHVVDTIAQAGLGTIVVVTHAAIASALDLASRPGVQVLLNDDPDSEMIDSIRMGLRWAAAEQARAPGFLVLPGDVPGVTAEDIRRCAERFAADPTRQVIAAHAGRRGHPVIFPADLAAVVHSATCEMGLRGLRETHRDRVVFVECGHDGVIRDVNTQEDYESFQSSD